MILFSIKDSRFCDICDKTITIKSKSKHNNSISRKHKRLFSVVVKRYEFLRPDRINCSGDCFYKNFHAFKLRCKYDIEMTNGHFVKGILSDKSL